MAAHVDIEWHLLVSVGVFWCPTASFSVLWCLEMRGGCLRSFSKGNLVLSMEVFKVWAPLRGHTSVKALYVQQLLYIGKSPKGKIPHTWHL